MQVSTMKFFLSLLVLFCSVAVIVDAFVPKPASTSISISTSTSTTATPKSTLATTKSKSTRLFYDIQRDPQPNDNVWSILSNTEKWISNTLTESQTGNNNPLSRKEVSYVCETSKDPAMILANVFRKVKEARQVGESHAQDQEDLIDELGGKGQ
jgi:hypothetical protein